MDLLFSVIFAWVATISVIMLSVIYILRKVGVKNKDGLVWKINKALRKHHKTIGIIAIVSGLLHGLYSSLPILSGNKGTLAFVVIILLGVSFMFRKKLKGKWAKSHRILAALTCALVILHVVEVGGFVGIDGLVDALEDDTVVYAQDNQENDDDDLGSDTDVDNETVNGDEVAAETVIENKNDEVLFDGLLLADGTYYGTADAFGPDLETEVIVENGLVTEVTVVSHNEKNSSIYGEAMDTVPVAIVDEQSLQVDSISGATYTSYGIMMSVENALEDAVIDGSLPGIEMPATSGKRH